MKRINGGVTRPKGFRANGMACGIKRSGKPDLALIVSDLPCAAAALYTKNSVKAAPLLVTREHLSGGRAQVVITNSGNANCFTGEAGLAHARLMAEAAAGVLGLRTRDVLVASTGIIGKPLPIRKIQTGMPDLVGGLGDDSAHGTAAAEAIMTTDTFVKEGAVVFQVNGKPVTIGGCAKGSGMIEPNMATMLAYLTTDAVISPKTLRRALVRASDRSFHCITVDGCMSTNDMVIVLANGQSGCSRLEEGDKDFEQFCAALECVCRDLAEKIVRDGEGAKKLIRIYVDGAPDSAVARQAAKAIANSCLVKTAAYGKNANWGRIAAAVGSLGLGVTEQSLKIKTSSRGGKDVVIHVHLGLGHGQAEVLTCDLTEDYVKINGSYN